MWLLLTNAAFANEVDEVDQAFSSPLWDQNGKKVRYEIFLNQDEFDFIVENELYNWDGQISYSQAHEDKVTFSSGDNKTNQVGAIELKLAWKVLAEKILRTVSIAKMFMFSMRMKMVISLAAP
ncbi:MAG: hypothetical protein AAGE84_25660 [Cyanobacteria bacterium P01_G01_bin.39]